MSADVSETSRNMCIEIYELDPARFISTERLTWKSVLKKPKVKLDFLTDMDMLLILQKHIKGWICHVLCRYMKANNKLWWKQRIIISYTLGPK